MTSMYSVMYTVYWYIVFINTQAAYDLLLWLKKYPWFKFQFYSLASNLSSYCTVQINCQKQRKNDNWTKNTNLRKPWWTYYTKLFEKINYSLKVSAFFSLVAFNCIAEYCHYINQSRDNKWLCDTVKSYKTKKSETLRLEFTFSILLSKVKKAFMELYQNVFKGLSQSNVFGGQIHSASV